MVQKLPVNLTPAQVQQLARLILVLAKKVAERTETPIDEAVVEVLQAIVESDAFLEILELLLK